MSTPTNLAATCWHQMQQVLWTAICSQELVQNLTGDTCSPMLTKVGCCLLKPVVVANDYNASFGEDGACILINNSYNCDHSNYHLVYARQKVELHMKHRKTNNKNVASINLEDLLCGIPVECERLFSHAKKSLTESRKSTSPVVFQADHPWKWAGKSCMSAHSGESGGKVHRYNVHSWWQLW